MDTDTRTWARKVAQAATEAMKDCATQEEMERRLEEASKKWWPGDAA